MSNQRPRVLIAGAGWRVTRFIIPALRGADVRNEDIVVLRKSSSAPGRPAIESIRTVTSLKELGAFPPDVVLNCVVATEMVAMQGELRRRFPGAVHFCDTPVLGEQDSPLQVMRTAHRGGLLSLEDWPLCPNLAHLATAIAGFSDASLRIEHFGIPVHFLALLRLLGRGRRWLGPALSSNGTTIEATLSGIASARLVAPKIPQVAKAELRTTSSLIEDFFEVEYTGHDDGEILYRLIDEHGIRYRLGAVDLSVHAVPPELLLAFAPFGDRKNVHELDKFIGLTQLFRRLFAGDRSMAYRYGHSVRDTLVARRLHRRGRARLW